jgi:hypothetical protein
MAQLILVAAEGIVKSYDSNLLVDTLLVTNTGLSIFYTAWVMSNGGQILLLKCLSDFEACKSQFLFDIATITEMEDIPNDCRTP